jgi:hypothetical protein
MSDSDRYFNIHIRPELEAEALREAEESLQRQVVKAQAAGKSYDNLAERLAGVRQRLQELDAAGGGQESVAKGAESVAKAAEAEGKSLGDLTKDLKTTATAAKGLGQIKQALAMIMSGNLVGALRAVTAGWRAMTLAMASNPLGAILAVLGALVTAFIMLKDKIGSSAEEIKKMADASAARIDNLKESIAKANQARIDAAIKQAKDLGDWYQRANDELVRFQNLKDADADAKLNTQLTANELERQRKLSETEDPNQKARINLDYDKKAQDLRQARSAEKAGDEVGNAAKALKIAAANLGEATKKFNELNELKDSLQRQLSQLDQELKAGGLISDQERNLKESAKLNNKRSLTGEEADKKIRLSQTQKADEENIRLGNLTYNQALGTDEYPGYLAKRRKEIADEISNLNDSPYAAVARDIQSKGGRTRFTDLEEELNKIDDLLAKAAARPAAYDAIKNQLEGKDGQGGVKQQVVDQGFAVKKASDEETAAKSRERVAKENQANVALQAKVGETEQQRKGREQANKELDDANKRLAQSLRTNAERLEMAGRFFEAAEKRVEANQAEIPHDATFEDREAVKNNNAKIRRQAVDRQQAWDKARNQAVTDSLADKSLALTGRRQGEGNGVGLDSGRFVKSDNDKLGGSASQFNQKLADVTRKGSVDQQGLNELYNALATVVKVMESTHNDSEENQQKIAAMRAELDRLQGTIRPAGRLQGETNTWENRHVDAGDVQSAAAAAQRQIPGMLPPDLPAYRNRPADHRWDSPSTYDARRREGDETNRKMRKLNTALGALSDGIDDGELDAVIGALNSLGPQLSAKFAELFKTVKNLQAQIKDGRNRS